MTLVQSKINQTVKIYATLNNKENKLENYFSTTNRISFKKTFEAPFFLWIFLSAHFTSTSPDGK